MDRLIGKAVSGFRMEGGDTIIIEFYSGESLRIEAYTEFDGCHDYEGSYFFIEGRDSKGEMFLDLDTKTESAMKYLMDLGKQS